MSNVARQMEKQLRSAQLDLLRRASGAAAEHHVGLYLVGGTVRDILSGNRPADLDLVATEGTPGFLPVLAERLGGEVTARSQFGTAKLRSDSGIEIDLASARMETYAHPGALPAVEPGTIDEDLARRDFTVNAMAVSLGPETWGDLLDPFGGRGDLEKGVVGVLHPGSFVDDATRILRAVRYAQRLAFRLEDDTERLLKRDLGHLGDISGDRLRHELLRIFREANVGAVLSTAQELGVLRAIHPALRVESGALARLEEAGTETTVENELLVLAVLVFSAPAEELSSIIGRLNMDGSWASVVGGVGSVREASSSLAAPDVRRREVFGLLRRLDPTSIEGCALATDDMQVRERLELYLNELRFVRPLLNGDDMMALGVPEGPLVGKLLDEILDARLEGLLSSRADEENYVRRSLESG